MILASQGMSQTDVDLIIASLTFVLSVGTSLIVASFKVGRLLGKIDNIEAIVRELRGMFVLKPREPSK